MQSHTSPNDAKIVIFILVATSLEPWRFGYLALEAELKSIDSRDTPIIGGYLMWKVADKVVASRKDAGLSGTQDTRAGVERSVEESTISRLGITTFLLESSRRVWHSIR